MGQVMDSTPQFSSVMPSLTVADLPKAIAFYEDVLGFRCAFTNGDPICFAIVSRGGVEVSLAGERLGGVAGKNNCYVKLLTGIETLYAEYEKNGAPITHPFRIEEYGMKEFMITDLEGNTVNFGQPVWV